MVSNDAGPGSRPTGHPDGPGDIAPMMLPPDDDPWRTGDPQPYTAERGRCPRCGNQDVHHHIFGLPAGPHAYDLYPDWVHDVGCVVPPFTRTCPECDFEWNTDPDTGSMIIENEARLYQVADATTDEQLAAWVSDGTLDIEAWIDNNPTQYGGIVIGLDTRGLILDNFPTTLATFWDDLLQLEDEIKEEWETAAREDDDQE